LPPVQLVISCVQQVEKLELTHKDVSDCSTPGPGIVLREVLGEPLMTDVCCKDLRTLGQLIYVSLGFLRIGFKACQSSTRQTDR
jgi:hypothetical protein